MDFGQNCRGAQNSCFRNHTDASPYREISEELQPSATSNVKNNCLKSNYVQDYDAGDELHCLSTKQKSAKRIPRKFSRAQPLTEEELDRKRVTANVQERRRMQRLNTALEKLKRAIPQHLHMQYRRLSKIKTLKLAIDYIGFLEGILKPNFEEQFCASDSQMPIFEADGVTGYSSEMCERNNVMLEDEEYQENAGYQTSLSFNLPSGNCGDVLRNHQRNAYFVDTALTQESEGFHYLEQF